MRLRAFAVAPLLAAAAPAYSLPQTLPPVDHCRGDASFVAFRERLRHVVAARHRDRLLALLDRQVMVDFGGGTGAAEFARRWSFDPEEHGNVWDQLATMLRLGCSNDNGIHLIPSLSGQLNEYGADELFELRLVLPRARLFGKPGNERTAAPVAAWSLGRVTNSSGDLWTGIRLADGRAGFMSDDELYEPLGYRMLIEKRRGRWTITAFVAGD
jgi:hypothetical protein